MRRELLIATRHVLTTAVRTGAERWMHHTIMLCYSS